MSNRVVAFKFNPQNHEVDTKYTFAEKDVIGLTMAPDGVCYANLKGFRQARIRVNDYMNLKEARNAAQTRKQ